MATLPCLTLWASLIVAYWSIDSIEEHARARKLQEFVADPKGQLNALTSDTVSDLKEGLEDAADAKEELQEAAEQLDGVKDKLDGEMANAASMKQQLGGVVQGATHLKDHLNNVLSNAGNIMGGLGSMGSMLGSYETVPPPPLSITNGTMTIRVPCYLFIKPCGDVQVPPEGIDFTFPFGHYRTKGSREIADQMQQTEHAFSQYTLYIACLIGGYFVYRDIRQNMKERRLSRSVSALRLKYGLVDISDDEDELDLEKTRQNRLDVNSTDFLATGNIYRVLAVMHPIPLPAADPTDMPRAPTAGWKWLSIAAQALICAYMQLFLPSKIMADTLSKWEFSGVKSPLWFMANGFVFAMMFGSTAALCTVFRGRAEAYISHGAEANYYITTHRLPITESEKRQAKAFQETNPDAMEIPVDDLDDLSSSSESSKEEGRSAASMTTQFLQVARYWLQDHCTCGCGGNDGEKLSAAEAEAMISAARQLNAILLSSADAIAILLRVNEVFWCVLSQLMSIVVSVMLVSCMFLKIATYTGEIAKIAMVAISLYFIFDLEQKLFEANPKLRSKYRIALKEQVMVRRPQFWDRLAMHVAKAMLWIIRFLGPLGLFGLVVVAWKNRKTGFVIGGSGLDA